MAPKIFSSQRGKPKLAVDGYIYRIANKNLTSINWRCEKAGCKGSLSTPPRYDDPNVVLHKLQEHNHGPQPESVEAKVARDRIKQAAATSQMPPRRIISEVMAGMSDGGLVRMGQRDAIRKQIQRKRAKGLDGVTQLPSKRGFQVPEQYQVVKEGANDVPFLLHDTLPNEQDLQDELDVVEYEEEQERRLLVLGTQTMVGILRNASNWMIDATFKVVPALFYQLLVIHGIYRDHVFPCLYILMPNKSEETYDRVFGIVKNIIGRDSPTQVIADLELAMHNAVVRVWPEVEIRGCYFHLTQALWRKVQEVGLATSYSNDENVCRQIKLMAALAFLPPEDVPEAFDQLKDETIDEGFEVGLYSYFELNYVGRKPARGPRRRPRFGIEMWNVRQRTQQGIPRTNNKLEGFHYAIQGIFDGVHSTIWRFLKGLQREHALLYVHARAEDEPPAPKKEYRDINARLQTLIRRHEAGGPRDDFLNGIAHNVNLNV